MRLVLSSVLWASFALRLVQRVDGVPVKLGRPPSPAYELIQGGEVGPHPKAPEFADTAYDTIVIGKDSELEITEQVEKQFIQVSQKALTIFEGRKYNKGLTVSNKVSHGDLDESQLETPVEVPDQWRFSGSRHGHHCPPIEPCIGRVEGNSYVVISSAFQVKMTLPKSIFEEKEQDQQEMRLHHHYLPQPQSQPQHQNLQGPYLNDHGLQNWQDEHLNHLNQHAG
ncbi:hypothetical protein C8R42DRAFT_717052 [Lentinula raphanica]|nr:hypothetical protein C8R42DRAFT_717052 [Lentinula raphanica]